MKQNKKQMQPLNHLTELSPIDIAFQNASGKIPFNMTNDYMFRAVLQENNRALRGLICSLLHLAEQRLPPSKSPTPCS